MAYLGDVPGDRRVVEVIVDVVVHAVGQAMEEIGHVRVPGGLPGPGSVVEHGAVAEELDHGHGRAHSVPPNQMSIICHRFRTRQSHRAFQSPTEQDWSH